MERWLCLRCGAERCSCEGKDRAPQSLIHSWCSRAISQRKSSASRKSDQHARSVARRGHERPMMCSGRYAGSYDASHPWHVGSERWAVWGGCIKCFARFIEAEERWLTGECQKCRPRKPPKVDPPAPIRHVDGYPLVPCPCGAVRDRRPGALVAWEVYTRRALHLSVERFSQLEAEDLGGGAVMLPALPKNDESRMFWEGEGEGDGGEETEDNDDPTRAEE